MEIYWIGFGDIHEKISLVNEIDAIPHARGILIAGDLTNAGGRNEANSVIGEIERRNPNVYAQIGNLDTYEVHEFLTEKGINTHADIVDLGHGVGLMGLGYSNPTPFNTPSEAGERQLAKWLKQAHQGAGKFDHLILMSHTPPYGTRSDRIRSGEPVGSLSVRQFIEETQPEVCLTGHIHEAKSEDRIGKTRIVNPGLFEEGGYAVIRLENGQLTIRLAQI